MATDSGNALFNASCVFAMALIAVTLCVAAVIRPVGGWTLAAMVVVSVLAIAGIIHIHKEERDGQTQES